MGLPPVTLMVLNDQRATASAMTRRSSLVPNLPYLLRKHLEFRTAVALVFVLGTLRAFAGLAGLAFAIALAGDVVLWNTLADDVVHGALRTLLGELRVVCVLSAAIGVRAQLDLHRGVIL